MRVAFVKKNKPILTNLLIILAMIIALDTGLSGGLVRTAFNLDEEIQSEVRSMFQNRNIAIINGDIDLIKSMYDTNTKYGMWAYEYELRKVKYLHNWEKKQGAKFIEINPTLVFRSIKDKGDKISINLLCSTEYKYVYEDSLDEVNSFRIGTYHVLDIVRQGEDWIIAKEWYKDPFGDSLNLERIDGNSIKEYILSQGRRDLSDMVERRIAAVEYADRYCGAASDEQFGFKYNKAYRNYNAQGGDCANFASQILYEGGKFRKTSGWSYDKNGATRAWVNADGFKNYMLNSGRASLIAYGSYEKVYKASYKLLPGDFIAYEKKGDITHISVVTGIDSKGYTLVSCHNTDRNRVPWDLGWSNSSIRYWLVRVHY
ncbi:MAG: amidase domain-containing protein [Clostridiales bacterium GWB2_37_7]|nr:MAG: amidase domain-containing protein [Clostridiales bacterium GWB2_37_7]